MYKPIHGDASNGKVSPEYLAWINMNKRCYNKSHQRYNLYGAKGRTVCSRWRTSYPNFLKDMGRRPTKNHSLDRKDNSKNYTPSNCRWGTFQEQQNNKTTNIRLTHGDKTQTLSDWARELDIKYTTLWARIDRGWSTERAFVKKGSGDANSSPRNN